MWQFVNLFFENTTWLKNITIMDGLFCAYQYFKHKVLFDGKSHVQRQLYEKRALTNNYLMFTIERYILYTFIYSIKSLCQKLGLGVDTFSLLAYIIVIPGIQNALLSKTELVYSFRKHVTVCCKYITAKTIYFTLCKRSRVQPKNMDIFAIYTILNSAVLLDIAKSYLTICAMYIMRSKKMTYYYYKAVKLAYYYSTGYLFNTMDPNDALFIVRHIINNSKWKRVSNIEFIHALYVLGSQDYNSKDTVATIYYHVVSFFAVWSCFSFLKAIHSVTSASILLIMWAQDPMCWEKVIKYTLLFMSLVLLGINDFVVTVVYLQYVYIAVFLKEIWFYCKNYKDIERIINYYDKVFVEQEYIVL